jgi:hypothetical protein
MQQQRPIWVELPGNPEAFTIMGPLTLWAELTGKPEVATIAGQSPNKRAVLLVIQNLHPCTGIKRLMWVELPGNPEAFTILGPSTLMKLSLLVIQKSPYWVKDLISGLCYW